MWGSRGLRHRSFRVFKKNSCNRGIFGAVLDKQVLNIEGGGRKHSLHEGRPPHIAYMSIKGRGQDVPPCVKKFNKIQISSNGMYLSAGVLQDNA